MVYSKTKIDEACVASSGLFVRKQPNKDAKKCTTIKTLKFGDVVNVCDKVKDSTWLYIEKNGRFGFINGEYVVLKSTATKTQLSRLKGKAAVEWAKKIASDNSFHYGVKSSKGGWANHHGCYFCGTNNGTSTSKYQEGKKNGLASTAAKKVKLLSQIKKSYCCNPFVTAAWKHGVLVIKWGNTPNIDCKTSRINLAGDSNKALNNTKYWKCIYDSDKKKCTDTKPRQSTLLEGDVLLADNHAMLWAGNGQIVEASGGDDGVKGSKEWNNSIRVRTLDTKDYWWTHTKLIYRYIGG